MSDENSTESSNNGQNAETRTTDNAAETKTFTQEQVNALLADQKRKVQSSYKDYDDLKTKASQLDALAAAAQTDAERAANEGRQKGREEALSSTIPRLVRAEFKAAAKGVLSADQLGALLEDLDLTKYVTEDGDADEERIAKKIAALAPKEEERRSFPDLGGGKRGGTAKSTNMNDVIRRSAGVTS